MCEFDIKLKMFFSFIVKLQNFLALEQAKSRRALGFYPKSNLNKDTWFSYRINAVLHESAANTFMGKNYY